MLRASGDEFSISAFLDDSPLASVARRPLSLREGAASSAVNFDVSSAELDDLPGQIGDAIAFLLEQGAEVGRLVQFPGIHGVSLDFAMALRPQLAAQSGSFPADLVRLAGALSIGLELSCYAIE